MSTETLISELDENSRQFDDGVVDALADARRRAVLRTLFDEESASLREVARGVARREHDGLPAEGAVDRLKIALHHRHLPKLADVGLVEYERGSRTVALTAEAASIRSVL